MNEPIANNRCVAQAAKNLGFPVTLNDKWGNWVTVEIKGDDYHFPNVQVPFNNGAIRKICRDKEWSYEFLGDELKMAKTIGYLNPYDEELVCREFDSIDEIVEDMNKNFSFPFLVKMNSGTKGMNAFIVNNDEEIREALESIFNKENRGYDYVAIAQEYIDIEKEFRVMWFRGEVLLIYEKILDGEKTENLNPLFNPDSRTEFVPLDSNMAQNIAKFLQNSQNLREIEYSGLDVAIDKKGQFWLLEANGGPILEKFAKDNGDEKLVEMYEKILKQI